MKTLTAQTHSLTECESELEERELKIELLSKQLSLAKSCRDKCKRQISELQSQASTYSIPLLSFFMILCEIHYLQWNLDTNGQVTGLYCRGGTWVGKGVLFR